MRIRGMPTVATWLLRLFCSSPEHESLIGDLLEEYQRGRGRFWYWRQVIAIALLRVYRGTPKLLVPANGRLIRQGFAVILFIAGLSSILLSDIWVIGLVGILGGVITGALIFLLGNGRTEPAKSVAVTYHRGIAIHHIPVEGAAGLLFVFATLLIFGTIPAAWEILVITGPVGILGAAILLYWHKHHPLKIQALDLKIPGGTARSNRC